MIERKFRYVDNPHHKSNWCEQCGLYYCWHPEVEGYRNDVRARHKFIPGTKDYFKNEDIEEEVFDNE